MVSFLGNIEDDENNKDFSVFAYLTANDFKFIYLVDKKVDDKREDRIRSFFLQLHYHFAALAMNPMYTMNSYIKDQEFDSNVRRLVTQI